MNITIHNPSIHFHGAPTMASALIAAMLRSEDREEQAQELSGIQPPQIGEYWQGQGGIYAGDFRGGDGSVFGLITGAEEDIGRARWAPEGSLDLSDWDGLSNTKALRDNCPAAKLAAEYTRDGHSDFYLPARREMLLGASNLHDTFGKDSLYWTSTSRAEHYAWAVDFEFGHMSIRTRYYEFRVRPFRRFIY